ncbi:ParB family protein (plasmid) [Vibrio tubiashii]|uniref:ParB family protein n=1 Tax=Vibrio tubiashii TaxID=29498 RepID=UPI003CE4E603
MAKKRGAISPLGNTVGSEEAQKNAREANLESLSRQLSSELEKAGESTHAFLARQFGLESVGQAVEWRLASGQCVQFHEVTLSYEQVKQDTFVTFDINGRDQSLLTPESLADLDSLEYQQFYPAVGREVEGKIDILDGSRRRAWFLLQQGKVATFRLLVTKATITVNDAKALAKQLQTAKEHNPREIGLQCLTLMQQDGRTQEDVAKMLNISRQSVGRAVRAANIDERLIALFPVVNELSHTDYELLHKVMKHFESLPDKLSHFIECLSSESPQASEVNNRKEQRVEQIKAALKFETAKTKTESDVVITPLTTFSSKSMYARKRIKGRAFSYEFARLPKSVQESLDEAIASVLSDYQQGK